MALRDEEETKDQQDVSKKTDEENSDDPEMRQISLVAKSVNIRFGNYSMLMRANSLGISSKLLALLGMGPKKALVDAGEEALLNSKSSKVDSGWD